MRSLSVAHWIFHALCCFAVGLISHNAYETQSLEPPRQNMLVSAVSTVSDSGVVHSVTGWAQTLLHSLVSKLEPYREPASPRRPHPPAARSRALRRR